VYLRIILLLCFALFNPIVQIFMECSTQNGEDLAAGCIVNVRLALDAFRTEVDVATWMMECGPNIHVIKLDYLFTGLTSLAISSSVDVTGVVRALSASTRLEDELSVIQRFHRQPKKTAPTGPRTQVPRVPGGRASARAGVPGEEPSDMPGEEPGDVPDELMEAGSELDDDDEFLIGDEVHDMAGLDDFRIWDVRREWDEVVQEAEPISEDPIVIPQSETVALYYAPNDPTWKLGRRSILRPGTATEGWSYYCYQHGCKIVKRSHQWPTSQQLLAWVKDGMTLAPGAAGRIQHTARWPNRVP
jgi:hypothetical protein